MKPSDALVGVLEEARDVGFLGPGPIEAHLESADRFLAALHPTNPARIIDLGSGGGVPALPLALELPDSSFVLLDAMERRTSFLAAAVERLGVGDRVTVVRERAEVAGRAPEFRTSFEACTARSFGAPAVTAECAAPFLCVGGVLVVSDPPEPTDRWAPAGLAELGLDVSPGAFPGVTVLVQTRLCPDRYPRRTGIPAKRPLF